MPTVVPARPGTEQQYETSNFRTGEAVCRKAAMLIPRL